MAADFIKKLVLLNLGATEDEWADAVAIDEEAVALDAYSKTGGVAAADRHGQARPCSLGLCFLHTCAILLRFATHFPTKRRDLDGFCGTMARPFLQRTSIVGQEILD